MAASGITVGVEEEFLLVDPESARTVSRAREVQARSIGGARQTGANVQRELRDTQLEVATGICTTATQLRDQLAAGRRVLALAGAEEGVGIVASATPLCPPSLPAGRSAVSRFARVDDLYGGMTRDYEACGCHVHVGVSNRDAAVAVTNHVGRWLPTLLALSVNSPFHDGHDTGHESWRMVQQSRFPGAGLAPWFADHAGWQAEVSRLVDCGVLVDQAQTFWLARPSPRLPTVEFRVADTAATVDDAMMQALLSRALVRTALVDLDRGVEAEPVPGQVAAAAVWSASRYGLDGPAVHLGLGKQIPATVMLAALLDHVRDALEDSGDLPEVRALLRGVRARGTAARRQRRLAAAGLPAVVRALALGA